MICYGTQFNYFQRVASFVWFFWRFLSSILFGVFNWLRILIKVIFLNFLLSVILWFFFSNDRIFYFMIFYMYFIFSFDEGTKFLNHYFLFNLKWEKVSNYTKWSSIIVNLFIFAWKGRILSIYLIRYWQFSFFFQTESKIY